MNALRATIRSKKPIPTATIINSIQHQRFSTAAWTPRPHSIPKPPVPECYLHDSFRTNFLSDPSVYPLFGAMVFATVVIVVGTANTLMNNNHDLRVFPNHKQEVLRTWGDEKEYVKLTRKMALGPIIMHEKDYRSIWQEGLGVNHEEWLKQKQQAE